MNIYEVSKVMAYEPPKKDIRPGDRIKQRHWPDIPVNWYRVLSVTDSGQTLQLEYPANPDVEGHQGGVIIYPMNKDWVVKRIIEPKMKKDIRIGDLVRQAHWDDLPVNWYKVVAIGSHMLKLEYPGDGDYKSGTTTYPKDLDWVVKRDFSDIRPKGPKLERRVSEEPEPELDEAVLREHIARHERMLRRFPSHPSDILIMLNDI